LSNGYGFGFSIYDVDEFRWDGESKTSSLYCYRIYGLGMMLPGMLSGFIQEYLGWKLIWVFVATIPGLILSRFSDIPERILEKIRKNQSNRTRITSKTRMWILKTSSLKIKKSTFIQT
jgi:PAT family beta-lactamase induction signal transducer AmpG